MSNDERDLQNKMKTEIYNGREYYVIEMGNKNLMFVHKPYKPNSNQVKELSNVSGHSMTKCKKYLIEAEGEIE